MRSDVFANKLLTKSVASMVNNVGFSHSSASSLSILTGITDAFLDGIARCCAAHTELGNRTLPNIDDALLATEQMGVELPDLWDYMFSVASFSMKEVPCFPVKTAREEDCLENPEMSPPRLEKLLEDNRARQKEREQLGLMEASELFDPSALDREQRAKSNFPTFFGQTAQSLGIKVERVGAAPVETMDISLDSLASPIMAIRRPISKIHKSKLKKKEEKRKRNIALVIDPPPSTVPPPIIPPQPLIESNRRVLEIRREATRFKILLPGTPTPNTTDSKLVLNTKKEPVPSSPIIDLTSDSDSDIEVVSEVIATPPRTTLMSSIPKKPAVVNQSEEIKENTTQPFLEPKTPCQANNPFRVEPGSGLKLRILRNVPRNV